MNPVVVVHFIAAVAAILLAVPLLRRKVRMNRWRGVRLPAAFESEAAWFEINQYAGRLLLVWGVVLAATATVGAGLTKRNWVAYDWAALVISVGGLGLVITKICRRRRA